ncbi:hypothetical protein JTE90_009738 [Oedothorax gibbosus]|uniref:C2H2-type domain-containing protein n=1 Tax=Oedothorax gibbosus TaxID=931172 RepID=A0AAV6V7P3_9ARAC|nr:hypothetical protein JTE90_009738 [Oedothorax gibbosus]
MKKLSFNQEVVCPMTSLTETTASPITITFICSVADPPTIPLYLRTGHEKKLCCNQEVVCPDDFTDRSHSQSHYNHVHMQCGRSLNHSTLSSNLT